MASPLPASAARLGFTAAGGVIAGALGALAGSLVGGALFGFGGSLVGGGPDLEGPRLEDLEVTSSAYGRAVPRGYGLAKVGGTIIWASDRVEETRSRTRGGLLGLGGTEITTWRDSADLAVAFGEGPVKGIPRLRAGEKLLLDRGVVAPGSTGVAAGSAGVGEIPGAAWREALGQKIRIDPGTADQVRSLIDPQSLTLRAEVALGGAISTPGLLHMTPFAVRGLARSREMVADSHTLGGMHLVAIDEHPPGLAPGPAMAVLWTAQTGFAAGGGTLLLDRGVQRQGSTDVWLLSQGADGVIGLIRLRVDIGAVLDPFNAGDVVPLGVERHDVAIQAAAIDPAATAVDAKQAPGVPGLDAIAVLVGTDAGTFRVVVDADGAVVRAVEVPVEPASGSGGALHKARRPGSEVAFARDGRVVVADLATGRVVLDQAGRASGTTFGITCYDGASDSLFNAGTDRDLHRLFLRRSSNAVGLDAVVTDLGESAGLATSLPFSALDVARLGQTIEGRDLRPFAPAAIRADAPVLAGNDVVITWTRRARIQGALGDGTGTVPLAGASEAYELDLLDADGLVLRTVTGLVIPGWVYTTADQDADGFIANDDRMTAGAGGATQHEWRVENASPMILAAGGLAFGTAADVVVDHDRVVSLRSWTVATAPSAPDKGAGAEIFVANGANGDPVPAFSDGAGWRRGDGRSPIAAS